MFLSWVAFSYGSRENGAEAQRHSPGCGVLLDLCFGTEAMGSLMCFKRLLGHQFLWPLSDRESSELLSMVRVFLKFKFTAVQITAFWMIKTLHGNFKWVILCTSSCLIQAKRKMGSRLYLLPVLHYFQRYFINSHFVPVLSCCFHYWVFSFLYLITVWLWLPVFMSVFSVSSYLFFFNTLEYWLE